LLARDPHFIQFAKGNGLIADKINFLAFTKRSVWAYADEGISVLPYQSVRIQSKSPEFYFKKLFINKKQTDFREPFKLPHDETDVSLSFVFYH